jgi:hypothetical protein
MSGKPKSFAQETRFLNVVVVGGSIDFIGDSRSLSVAVVVVVGCSITFILHYL